VCQGFVLEKIPHRTRVHLRVTGKCHPSQSATGRSSVSTAAQLQAALADAVPGQVIELAAGTYRGSFVTTKAGTAAKPITLSGPANAVLINDGPSGEAPGCPAPTVGWDSGYGLWLSGAPYWNLTGFTVQESKKGIVVDDSPHTTIDGVTVHHVDEEAIHFRRSSADSVLKNSTITYTGLVQAGYGEGVYLGSATSNWVCHGNSGGVDRGDRIQVLDNHIGPFVAAEPIDVKECTFDGLIRGNTQHEHLAVVPQRLRERVAWQQVRSRRCRRLRDQDQLGVEVRGEPERGVRVEHGHERDSGTDEHPDHAVITGSWPATGPPTRWRRALRPPPPRGGPAAGLGRVSPVSRCGP
jgi:hypothetical protein